MKMKKLQEWMKKLQEWMRMKKKMKLKLKKPVATTKMKYKKQTPTDNADDKRIKILPTLWTWSWQPTNHGEC